jgi:hypothetical protein
MSRRSYSEPITQEDIQRLQNVLRRRGGSCTLRDLYRRHSFWDTSVFAVAAEAGLIRIEERRPRTGRPSKVAVLCAEKDSNPPPAKLPRRTDLPLGLNWRERRFLKYYGFRWGTSYFGEGRNAGCATHAYLIAFERPRGPSTASDRSSASRLLGRSWIRAAIILDRRLMAFGGRCQYPADLRTAGDQWLNLLLAINRACLDWPANVASAVRSATSYPDALQRLNEIADARQARPVPEHTVTA